MHAVPSVFAFPAAEPNADGTAAAARRRKERQKDFEALLLRSHSSMRARSEAA